MTVGQRSAGGGGGKGTAVAVVFLVLFFQTFLPARGGELLVKSYYGRYDAARNRPGFPAENLTGPWTEAWGEVRPAGKFHIGVLLPHLNDPYWATANFGIITRAAELGVEITLYLAGAYTDLGNQRSQLRALYERDKVDGVILASVDYQKMDPFVAEADLAGVPVVALINDIFAPAIKAKSMVSFHEMGYEAGEFVLRRAAGQDISVAFFPGPQDSGWAPATYRGFLAAVESLKAAGQTIRILPPLYGDTRPDVQQMRLDALNKAENRNIDYIVGNAVAAVEAVSYLDRHRRFHPRARIVASYLTAAVFEQIERGEILAAPSDQIVSQCRIALDMMVRILNGERPGIDFPFHAAPLIHLVTVDNIGAYGYESLFGARNFQPVYKIFKQPPSGRRAVETGSRSAGVE